MNESHLVLTVNRDGGIIFIPILKMRTLKLRNIKVTQLIRRLAYTAYLENQQSLSLIVRATLFFSAHKAI